MTSLRTIDFPDEWATAKPVEQQTFKREHVVIAAVLLDDGSGLWALIFDGGHRFARTAGYTDWAIEERFYGEPTEAERAEVDEAWKFLLDTMIRAGHEADAEISEGGQG